MAKGDVSGGLEKLDAMEWIKESGPDYLRSAAHDYLQLSADSKKSVILVTPTWEENHTVTEFVRYELRNSGKLGQGITRQIWEPLEWTEAQRGDCRNYQPGQVLQFTEKYSKFKAGDSLEIVSASDGGIVAHHSSGKDVQIPMDKAEKFQVFRPGTIEVAEGDKLLLRENRSKADLANGDVITVSKIETSGAILTTDGKLIPSDYNRITHGYALTSYRSQGRTADHVVVAAGRLDKKTCYVACSRARESCSLHTPSKEALLNSFSPSKTGNRKTVLEGLGKAASLSKQGLGLARLATALRPAVGHARTALTIANRAMAWASIARQPVTSGALAIARMCIPGVGKIQMLVSLASVAYQWTRGTENEIQRKQQHEMLRRI